MTGGVQGWGQLVSPGLVLPGGRHRLGLGPAAMVVDPCAEQAFEPDERHWLVEEGVDAETSGRLRAVGQAVGGEDDDRRGLAEVPQVGSDGEPLGPDLRGEADVGDDRVKGVTGQAISGFLQAGCGVDLEARPGEVGLVDASHGLVVVDHQEPFAHASLPCKPNA